MVLADASIRGHGGRNQHLVLSAASALIGDPRLGGLKRSIQQGGESIVLVSGGTDGEDGSTQAAGAWVDSQWIRTNGGGLAEIDDALRRCDSFGVFQRLGGLLQTGPTHTNVCDLRVLVRG